MNAVRRVERDFDGLDVGFELCISLSGTDFCDQCGADVGERPFLMITGAEYTDFVCNKCLSYFFKGELE